MKETIKNLVKSFIGESQARNRYTFYASAARKEGYEQIGAIFQLTADNEKEHAKRLYELLAELAGKEKLSEVEVESKAPIKFGKTLDNLRAAAIGEKYEWAEMYPEFAKIAKKEGLGKIATRFSAISVAEKHHEERFKKLIKEVENGAFFKKTKAVWWVCRECGYIHLGTTPPEKCPSCDHPKSFYELQNEKY